MVNYIITIVLATAAVGSSIVAAIYRWKPVANGTDKR